MKNIKELLVLFIFAAGLSFAQSNSSVVEQTGNNQIATVTQLGSENSSKIDQFTDNDGVQVSTVMQVGRENRAVVSMDQIGGGTNSPNIASLVQTGFKNVALQSVYAPAGNYDQFVTGIMNGSNNHLVQKIEGGYDASQLATIIGSGNTTSQISSARIMEATVYQNGFENRAVQRLSGSNHGNGADEILISQVGAHNDATQLVSGGTPGTSTNVVVWQNGNQNKSTQVTDGLDHNAVVNQLGNHNTAYQELSGNENTASIISDGFANYGKQVIDGDLNTAILVQRGSLNGSISLITGDNNTITVTQSSSNNFSRKEIIGSNNNVTVIQN